MKREILLGIFVGSLITANFIAGVKLVNLWGFVVPAGFLAYAVTFPITDAIGEVYGKKEATKFVWAGFVANLFSLALVWTAYYMPPLMPEMQETFAKAFVPMTRIVIASMVAYIISQNHDVWAFHFWKRVTGGKYLWLRNNASTIVSQFLDTVVFISLAFWGVIPTPALLAMIWSQWLWKIAVALADTPFVYAVVKLLGSEARILNITHTYTHGGA